MKEIYTDGSTRRNGNGGYGFIVIEDEIIIDRFVYKEFNTTNQRCELLALISACKYCKDNKIIDVIIFSDSAYCLNANFEKWYINWEKNGWLNSKKNPVKNRDLWEELIPFYKENLFIFKKVKGHTNSYYNNFIDSLVTTISSEKTQDLTGKRFERLVVLNLYSNSFTEQTNTTKWLCQCDCGNTTIVSHGNLINSTTRSCGCLQKENHYYKNYEGEIFNFIQIQKKLDKKDNQGYFLWEAKCLNCQSTFVISSRNIGKSLSCGCIKSKGEFLITDVLNHMNGISYVKEFSFDDLMGDKLKLKFDFAIFKNNNLLCLVEYQGVQHFKTSSGWNNEEKLRLTQEYDNKKRNYCIENNIPLIEIPYTDYEKINDEFFLTKFDFLSK